VQKIQKLVNLRLAVKGWRSERKKIAFVPTMGNLHDGHLKLVKEAKLSTDKVVVSVFVNPTQFVQGEDFEAYPRTEAEDQQKLASVGIDALFLPSVSEMYGEDAGTIVSVKNLSTILCGQFRPGHFDGVATVVCKLFNMVQPDIAFFGQKDYQQLMIIRTLVRDLNIPVEIRSTGTVREISGLAMSSRNGYLNPNELQVAPKLYKTLCTARDRILAGEICYETIEEEAVKLLQYSGFVTDYFSIRNSNDLSKAEKQDIDLIILAAAKLGKTRLIDNVFFRKPSFDS
jgi:pantoate--beta-alanine ligase